MSYEENPFQKAVVRSSFYNKLILTCLFILFAWIGYLYLQDSRNPRIRDITVGELVPLGPVALCPGQILLTSFDLEIEGEGVIIRDTSVQQTQPLSTIIFSEMLRAPLIGPVEENVKIAWPIPLNYYDYRTGVMTEMNPGLYYQIVAVSSTGRNALSEVESIEFQVKPKEQCVK